MGSLVCSQELKLGTCRVSALEQTIMTKAAMSRLAAVVGALGLGAQDGLLEVT